MTTVEEKLEVNLSFMRIASMMVKLLFLSHILACFWFYGVPNHAGRDIPHHGQYNILALIEGFCSILLKNSKRYRRSREKPRQPREDFVQ